MAKIDENFAIVPIVNPFIKKITSYTCHGKNRE